MARRKQLRRRQSQTSSSTSSSASPSPLGPPSPSVARAPAGAPAAGGSHSPGQTLAAARASLKQSTSLADKQLPSPAMSTAASASTAPAETAAALPAAAVLGPSQTEAAKVDASADVSGAVSAALAAAAAETSDGPNPDQNCPAWAACSAHGGPATGQALEAKSSMPADPAASQPGTDATRWQQGNAQPDMDPTRSQQEDARAGAEAHIAPQPTRGVLPVSIPGSWLQLGAQETESSCTPLIGMKPSAFHHTTCSCVLAGHASVMPAVKPHPRSAFAKPGSHQNVVLTPEAAIHQRTAEGVMSHRLGSFADTDDVAGS